MSDAAFELDSLPSGRMEPSPDGLGVPEDFELIVRADREGVILFVSEACRALGYEPEDLIGRSSIDLVHPDDLDRFMHNMASLYQPGMAVDPDKRVHRYRRKDGTWIWLKGGPKVAKTHDGRLGDIVNVFRPLTD